MKSYSKNSLSQISLEVQGQINSADLHLIVGKQIRVTLTDEQQHQGSMIRPTPFGK